jgi:HEAT repeat protein
MTRSTPFPQANTPSGHEPSLGGGAGAPDLTGYEPLLGGIRREGADMQRVEALLTASAEERRRILTYVERLGQTDLYAQELAQIVPARARRKMGSWRGSFTPGERQQAMNVLREIGCYESIVPLLDALQDDIYEVRKAAEHALIAICGRLPADDRRTGLAYRALTDALAMRLLSARKVVARVLADAPPDLVLGPLLNTALRSQDWWVRREAAWVLGMLGDRRATRRLIEALGDGSTAVRASAAWGLGRIDAPVAVGPLVEALDDPDEVVRAAAVEALGEQAARLSPLDGDLEPALARLLDSLEDPDISVRQAAVETLARLAANPEARRTLRALRGDGLRGDNAGGENTSGSVSTSTRG